MAQFLSDEWVQQAREIREEFKGKGQAIPHKVRINLNITDVPFGDGTVEAHIDTSTGEPEIDTGHIEGATTTVTTDYAIAKAVFVDNDQSVAMQAYMGGKVKVTGDLTQVMAMLQVTPDAVAAELGERMKAITD